MGTLVKKLLAALIGTVALAGAAQAQSTGSVSYTSNSVTDRSVAFTDTLNLQQFDAAQYGTLQSIILTLNGSVSGSAGAENTSDEADSVNLRLSATETLRRPDGSSLVVVIPAVNRTADLGAFDGTEDYAGTSGVTYGNLSGTLANTQTFTDAATLALFTGTSSVAAGLRATGASVGTGSGNEDFKFVTRAGGFATVTYNYITGAVPEPGTWMMMIVGFGFVGLGLRRQGASPIFN